MDQVTQMLLAALVRIPKAPTFLTSLLFGGKTPIYSGNAQVAIQLYRAGHKLAPISTPARGGVIMTHYGYDDIVVEAPLMAPEWDMSELHNTPAPGELTMMGPDGNVRTVTTEDRLDRWRGLKMAEGLEMFDRRREWMVAKQLTTGQIALKGEGNYNVTIDIGWDNDVTVSTAWDASGADPFADIEAQQQDAIEAGVTAPNVLVLAPDAASAFMTNAKVKERLQFNAGYTDPIFNIERLPGTAARRIGYIRELDLMVYSYGARFADPENNGVMTPFIPSGTGVLVPSADINDGVVAYGAIYDDRFKSWFSGETYVREYSRSDGHAGFLQLNQRVVNCLTEAESWYNLKGLTTSYGG